MLRTLSKILDILTMAVGALGGISLLVGGVGIVTIMTIAVTERTGEIGLLVALGAPRRTILWLFLGEAVALSALGGIAGLVLGIGLAQLIHLAVAGAAGAYAAQLRRPRRSRRHRHRPAGRRPAGPPRGTARSGRSLARGVDGGQRCVLRLLRWWCRSTGPRRPGLIFGQAGVEALPL